MIRNKCERIFTFIFVILLLIFIIFLCFRKKTVTIQNTTEALDTVITVKLSSDSLSENELNEVSLKLFEEINRLSLIFSATDENSELFKLNNSKHGTPYPVSDELFDLFEISLKYAYLTDGAFDITLGKLINIWDITGDEKQVPSDDAILPLKKLENYKDISLDFKLKTVTYNDDFDVNLGAIAKGYIGDKVKALAKSLGVSFGTINMGGNILAIGEKEGGKNWNIAITNPKEPSSYFATVSVKDKCVVTSGNYERYFIKDGKRYHHILDPFTGYPSENGIVSVTIIGDNSATCDALSTGCYVLGLEKSLELINKIDGYDCILINENGDYFTSGGISKYNLDIK